MRGLLLAATAGLLAVVLVACAGAVDTTKVTYRRTTVPAGQGGGGGSSSSGEATSNDPAFTTEKLRTLDPCGVLTKDILAGIGEPVENNRNDFSACANYMRDAAGDSLSITLTIGENVSNAEQAEQTIGGLPAIENELDSGDACFTTVVTSTSPDFGISIQAGGDAKDLCAAARTVLTGVVDLIRTDPVDYESARGTLLELDACETVEDGTLRTTLGESVDAGVPYNLHWCNWHSSTANLGVWLRLGFDPGKTGEGRPVALGGGVTGYTKFAAASPGTCEIQWAHRQFSGDETEIVHLFYDKLRPAKGDDPCKPTVALAKTLVTTLPKA